MNRLPFSHPRYEPRGELGRGAQGVVLRVVDKEAPSLALVAKVFRDTQQDEEALRGEFGLLARARIPGLVRAHDLGRCTLTGALFLVEDFIDGPDAASWIHAGDATLSSRNERIARVIGDVAITLSALHEAGSVHGDLKPAHLRVATVQEQSRTHVLDLGAALHRARWATGATAFTRAFAAPEILAGGAPSPASDLFSLGALLREMACGDGAVDVKSEGLSRVAPWLARGVSDLIASLSAPHPRDRPESARHVLRAIGAVEPRRVLPAAPIGREREIAELAAPHPPRVRYLVGPSGVGKSHVARELVTRALLAGRPARLLRFPERGGAQLPKLVAFLRGDDAALPFFEPHEARSLAPLLLVLDDLQAAPTDLVAALDLYRCRASSGAPIEILATTREAPDGAPTLALEPLDPAAFRALAHTLGLSEDAAVEKAALASSRLPGWLVATVGSVPLAPEVALDRASQLSASGRELLAAIAIAGGSLDESVGARLLPEPSLRAAFAELSARAFVTREAAGDRVALALTASRLADALAGALATPALIDRVGAALLADPAPPVDALLAVARTTAGARAALFDRARRVARDEGRASEEIEALLGLARDEATRTPEILLRLERLTRDTGRVSAHPEVLAWLVEASERAPHLRSLVLRRRAEKAAREGVMATADTFAEEARVAAGDDLEKRALVLATAGVVALHRAAYERAAEALDEAARLAAEAGVDDHEELARIDHNRGVVALYRGQFADAATAFERSLGIKRALGDRAGMRACLLNLGLARAKTGELTLADEALEEAMKLARSLRQVVGCAWVLAARADVAVRRRDPRAAARFVGEALGGGAVLPPSLDADLTILRAETALLEGDGRGALAELAVLSRDARAADALVDARAHALEAHAALAMLPVDRRGAARLAIAAIRRARAAGLPEVETHALAALRAARGGPGPNAYAEGVPYAPPSGPDPDAELWSWLDALARGDASSEPAPRLAKLLARASGAERAFVLRVDESGEIDEAFCADLDGMPISPAMGRVPADLVRAAVEREGPVYHRDADGPQGGGVRAARLAIAGPPIEGARRRGVVVLEHRFAPSAFDRIEPRTAARWATLASLAFPRSAANASEPRTTSLESDVRPASRRAPSVGETTSIPHRMPTRAYPGIIGRSPALLSALARLEMAMDSDLPVLLIGETGAGKELFARALHELGARSTRGFVAVNCGAIPDALFEAELFGHARGSFTGADRARPGLFARAERGTFLLDEIGELPLVRQAALLRALEERRYRPVGSDEEVAFDIRFVAATNRDLEALAASGDFRKDLLYRLNTIEIRVPPLRERREDMAELATTFLARAGSAATIAPEALAALRAYDWPGNIRELEHLAQRLALTGARTIELAHLPRTMRAGGATAGAPSAPIDHERAEVERALATTGGNISRAAALLDLTRHGLKKRMVRLGMRHAKTTKETVADVEEEAG